MQPSQRTLLRFYGLPVIDSIDSLSERTRLSKGLLYKMAKHSRRFYRVFQVPKSAGGERVIAQPSRSLKAVQAWILREILGPLRVSRACKGFAKGESVRSNALAHAGANALLHIDIEDFFPSVGVTRVYYVFRTIGYNNTAAGLLASLCTLEEALPQGAPSSPKLANLACLRLDARLLGFAGKRGIVYTRYADDLTFSASRIDTLAMAFWVIKQIVRDEGFRLNERKTRLVGPARRRRVTGLVLSGTEVGIGRERLRELRSKIHHLCHTAADKTDDSVLNHVQGWLAYVKGVDPIRAAMLSRYVTHLSGKCPESAVTRLRCRG